MRWFYTASAHSRSMMFTFAASGICMQHDGFLSWPDREFVTCQGHAIT